MKRWLCLVPPMMRHCRQYTLLFTECDGGLSLPRRRDAHKEDQDPSERYSNAKDKTNGHRPINEVYPDMVNRQQFLMCTMCRMCTMIL